MQRVREGSAVMMVLVITTVVVACVINVWRCSTYTAASALAAQQHEAAWRATEGLLNYAIALVEHNGQALIEHAEDPVPLELKVAHWPVDVRGTYAGIITLTPRKEGVAVAVTLTKDLCTVCTMHCAVRINKEGADGTTQPMAIYDWNDGSYQT